MTSPFINSVSLINEFELPKQDLKKLSLCSHKNRQMEAWLNTLTSTQAKHTSILFYKLLPELNQLAVKGQQQFVLMNMLRPFIYQSANSLAEIFLKNPLHLTEDSAKAAAIAQGLHRYLGDGYIIASQQILEENKHTTSDSTELGHALYYRIHCLSQLLYRSHQLYIPAPPMVWKKLHRLYLLAKA